MQKFVARVSSADPLYIANQSAEPNSGQRELHILFRDVLRARINIGASARIPERRVTPLSQAIIRLRSSLLNASSSAHGNGVTPPTPISLPQCCTANLMVGGNCVCKRWVPPPLS